MSGVPEHVQQARAEAELLVAPEQVQFAIDQVAVRMTTRLATEHPLLLCVLQGGFMYAAELAKRFDFPLQVAFVHVARYGDRTTGGTLRWLTKPELSVSKRHVLLVDDILDTGNTLLKVSKMLLPLEPKSLKTCVLLDKKSRRSVDMDADFIGFDIPDEFVVGYGLDFAESYRQLPYIGVLKKRLYR